MSHPSKHAPRTAFVRSWTGRLAAALAFGAFSACSQSFPSAPLGENLLGALILLQESSLSAPTITPASSVAVAAGATYQFGATAASGGTLAYSVTGCTGATISSTGLFTAGTASGSCRVVVTETVTSTTVTGETRTRTQTATKDITVHTLPGTILGTLDKNGAPALYAYFRFTGNGEDSSQNAQTITPGGSAVTYLTSATTPPLNATVYPSNQYIRLTANNQQLTLASFDPQAAAAADGFSAEVWFRLTTYQALQLGGQRVIVGQSPGCAGANRAWIGVDAATTDQIGSNIGGTTIASGVEPEINKWYHVVVTVRGSSLKIYVNGLLRKTASVSVESCSTTLNIGSLGGGSYFIGDLDEVAIYQTELDLAAVQKRFLAANAKTLMIDRLFDVVALNQARTLIAIGGQSPYTWTLGTGIPGGLLDASTGVYTAPVASTSITAGQTESFTITDTHGNAVTESMISLFLPNSAPNLTVWLTPAVLKSTLDGGSVPSMIDISGNNVLFVQPLMTNQPVFRHAGNAALPNPVFPAIEFDGTDDALRSASSLTNLTAVTIFAVAKRTGGAGLISHHNGPGGDIQANNAAYEMQVGGSLQFFHENGIGVNRQVTASAALNPAVGTWGVYGTVRRTDNVTIDFYNDALTNTQTLPSAADGSTSPSTALYFGLADDVAVPNFGGQLAEAVIYYRQLNAAELAHLRCYFKAKYAFTYSIATVCQ